MSSLSAAELARYDVGRIRPGSEYDARFPLQRPVDLGADIALYGEVDRYQDAGPRSPYPVVDFSLRAIDTHSQQAIWSSISFSKGDDGVFFFDAGSVATAQDLTSRMVRSVMAQIEDRRQ